METQWPFQLQRVEDHYDNKPIPDWGLSLIKHCATVGAAIQ